MNKILPTSIEYITPSRTIEHLTIQSRRWSRLVYVYNFEGTHFRFFDSLVSILQYFQTGKEPIYSFTKEEDLDDFLKNYNLKTNS